MIIKILNVLKVFFSAFDAIIRSMAALFLLIVGIITLFGITWKWFNENIQTVIVVGLSLILGAIVIDRYFKLDRIEDLIKKGIGVEFIKDGTQIFDELQNMVESASSYVYIIGAKSTRKSYLDIITKKVSHPNILYSRLLTGNHITHDIHKHLDTVVGKRNVQITWHPSEKYQAMVVTEKQAVIVLPTPDPNSVRALKFPGEANAREQFAYFTLSLKDERAVEIRTKKGVEILCEKCSVLAHSDEKVLAKALKSELE